MSALSAMQDKTQHLENSLSAETRIKLDLFSALGDAKRQLEIAQGRKARPTWDGTTERSQGCTEQTSTEFFLRVWCLSSVEIRS